jgi:predicted MFS family arabinose efflux permease
MDNGLPPRLDWGIFKILLGGIFGLVVVTGIGRFAFTPILPLMKRDLGMSNSVAGALAGANYLGYLAGAILFSTCPRLLRSRPVAVGALLASLATTTFMGLTTSDLLWGMLRLGGGFASVTLFIVISAEIGGTLIRRGFAHRSGALYGGVGLGIALSGLAVPQLDKAGGWDGTWIGMGVIAALFAAAAIALVRNHELVLPADSAAPGRPGELRRIWLPTVAYFLEGLGYVAPATFIVTIIAATPGLKGFAPYSWVAVGLAAIPSTIFWPHLARRIGNKPALLAAFALQAAGILVSMHADSVVEVVFAAVSFGGTFLGITALTLAEGSLRMPDDKGRAAAFLTASFGVGQMLGPVIAGRLADLHQGFAMPLLLAALCVALGGVFIAADRRYQPPNP